MFNTLYETIESSYDNRTLTLDKQMELSDKIISAMETGDLDPILARLLVRNLLICAHYHGVQE